MEGRRRLVEEGTREVREVAAARLRVAVGPQESLPRAHRWRLAGMGALSLFAVDGPTGAAPVREARRQALVARHAERDESEAEAETEATRATEWAWLPSMLRLPCCVRVALAREGGA